MKQHLEDIAVAALCISTTGFFGFILWAASVPGWAAA